MEFKQYHKTDFSIEASEDAKFRRYIEHEHWRMLKYIEGTLEKIEPRDFGNMTIFKERTFQLNALLILDCPIEEGPVNNIKTIELSEKITQFGTSRDSKTFDFVTDNRGQDVPLQVIFPSSLGKIYGRLVPSAMISGAPDMIWDFSKMHYIPTWETDSATASGIIKVPSSLYQSWINATNWSSVAEQIEPV